MPTSLEIIATVLFVLAILHTFSTRAFERLAHRSPRHAGLWHLLGEVEVVFGFWAFVLIAVMALLLGGKEALHYLESRNFTEPAFVFVIMVMAASRPVLALAGLLLERLAGLLPLPRGTALYATTLLVAPLLGSYITEPAAMTLAALLLRSTYFQGGTSEAFKYATLGTLFVNVSIGGTLTPFAAPPVLMVAEPWGWDTGFMLSQFGWKAVIATFLNTLLVTWLHRGALAALVPAASGDGRERPSLMVMAVHVAFAAAAVALIHHPIAFLCLFLLFLGFTDAYPRHQSPLILREALLVAFFLAGLVTLGGLQKWWLQPALQDLPADALFFGALVLTAFTDNAALTYLGTLVEGTDAAFRYALVAGAVTGGGLTVIANAPNPAGLAILKGTFEDGAVGALGLLKAALAPTGIAILCFWLLPS